MFNKNFVYLHKMKYFILYWMFYAILVACIIRLLNNLKNGGRDR